MVKHVQLTSASLTIYHLIDTNTIILAKDGTVRLAHERDLIPDFLFAMQQKDFLLLSRQTKQDDSQSCLFTNEMGLTYLSKLIAFEGDEANIWILGPFLMQMPDLTKIDSIFQAEPYKRNVMQEFMQSLKLFGSSRIQSAVNMLEHAGMIRQAPYNIVDLHSDPSDRLNGKELLYVLQQPDEHDTKLMEVKYELEKEIMHAVESGDKQKLKETMSQSKNWFDFSSRFPNQPIRAMKNMLIVFNTILRKAAENGKVHPFFLHHISEKFSKQIERSESINSLNSLLEVMQDEYCDLVKNRAVSGYSQVVQKAAHQIKIYFSKPLNLKQLAELCLVHPAHLSRQFKKETGMTLTDYQNRMRIDEAKLLLKEGSISIDRIAGYIGYDDAGYFARIFKKREGMTPTMYRNTI
jgi:YesN/AraC family two-component response regulator